MHPSIGEFFDIAGALGFKVILTTNGTLLSKKGDMLLSKGALHKVSISLHAYEANEMGIELAEYLASCFDFCKKLERLGVKTVICTDISKDGTLSGVNGDHLRQLKETLSIKITASGGVRDMNDIRLCKELGLYGAICGKSLYSGTLNLEGALECCRKE